MSEPEKFLDDEKSWKWHDEPFWITMVAREYEANLAYFMRLKPRSAAVTMDWLPFETVPRIDCGEEVLVYDALDYSMLGTVWCVSWIDGQWWEGGDDGQRIIFQRPTHWMPLPQAPASELAKIKEDAA